MILKENERKLKGSFYNEGVKRERGKKNLKRSHGSRKIVFVYCANFCSTEHDANYNYTLLKFVLLYY